MSTSGGNELPDLGAALQAFGLPNDVMVRVGALLERLGAVTNEFSDLANEVGGLASLYLVAIYFGHLMGEAKVIVKSGEMQALLVPEEENSPEQIRQRVDFAAGMLDRLVDELARIQMSMQPEFRAVASDRWTRWAEKWTTKFRGARNGHMVDALTTISPTVMARHLDVSKQYVLRVRKEAAS